MAKAAACRCMCCGCDDAAVWLIDGLCAAPLFVQEQIRVLTQRKVELAAAEEAAKASPEEQKEVRSWVRLVQPRSSCTTPWRRAKLSCAASTAEFASTISKYRAAHWSSWTNQQQHKHSSLGVISACVPCNLQHASAPVQALMARIKRDNAAVEQMTSEAKQLQAKVKQLEARQGSAASSAAAAAAAAGGGSVIDDPTKR